MKIPTIQKNEIAKKVGVSRQTLRDFENGIRDTKEKNKEKIRQYFKNKIQEIQKYINKIS